MHLARILLATAGLAALVGCGKERQLETAAADTQCTRCHGGTDNASGAPPRDTRGNLDPAVLTVGRHTAHLNAGFSCESCHPARPTVTMPGHLDGNVDVAFAGVAVARGATPAFDAQAGTCSNVYCHGATLNAGGAKPALVWNGALGAPRCGQCHGFPPPAPHPPLSQCSTCHPATVSPDGTLVAGGGHVNGAVDLSGVHPAGFGNPAAHGPAALASFTGGQSSCSACHGADLNGGAGPSCTQCHAAAGFVSPAWTANCTFCHGARNVAFDYAANLRQAAPPAGVAGATTGPTVGAHQLHLAPTRGATVACAACHAVPTQAAPLAHLDGTATVAFSGAAAGTFDASTQTCAVSCHGTGLGAGGALNAPTWTTPGPLACDSCHGAPPSTGRHPGAEPSHAFMGTNCGICHSGIAGVLPAIVDRTRHVNGVKDVSMPVGTWDPAAKTCASACHGTLEPFNWAR